MVRTAGVSFLVSASISKDSPTTSDVHVDSVMNDRKRRLKKKRMRMEAALQKGDYVGHPFRGNQWTGGGRGGITARGGGLLLAATPPGKKAAGNADNRKARLGTLPNNPQVARPAKPKTQREEEYDLEQLTNAQYKKYEAAPKNYDHEQALALALGKIKPMNYARIAAQAAKRGDDLFGKAGYQPPTVEHLKKLHEANPDMFIPPAWKGVVVSKSMDGVGKGMLALGLDAQGKTQPVQSLKAKTQQAAAKFERVFKLAQGIDKLDAQMAKDSKTNDAAACVMLMRQTGMRVDSGDAKNKKTSDKAFGASSLQAQHVSFSGNKAIIEFVGKDRVLNRYVVTDKATVAMLKEKKAGKRGATEIFNTSSDATQKYIRDTMGDKSFKNHDLRTLLGTTTAIELVKRMKRPTTFDELRKSMLEVGTLVSKQLNNKPQQALESYIAPQVFANWYKGIK